MVCCTLNFEPWLTNGRQAVGLSTLAAGRRPSQHEQLPCIVQNRLRCVASSGDQQGSNPDHTPPLLPTPMSRPALARLAQLARAVGSPIGGQVGAGGQVRPCVGFRPLAQTPSCSSWLRAHCSARNYIPGMGSWAHDIHAHAGRRHNTHSHAGPWGWCGPRGDQRSGASGGSPESTRGVGTVRAGGR